MTSDKTVTATCNEQGIKLPVLYGARASSSVTGYSKWRHSSAFIAQLAGQMSETRQDKLHQWRRPKVASEAYVRTEKRSPARRVHKAV